MDLRHKQDLPGLKNGKRCARVSLITCHSASFSPAEEGFSEVVLRSVLWLHPSLEQHLLVELLLLLLLLHMLPHAQTLPVIFLDVLCGVEVLDKHTCTPLIRGRKKKISPLFIIHLF